jgi:hypothetical protein
MRARKPAESVGRGRAGGRIEALNPRLVDINVARCAQTGASALGRDFDPPVANDLHHAPSVERSKLVLAAVMIDHEKNRLVFC